VRRTRGGLHHAQQAELYAAVLKFAQARLSPPTFGQIASEAALRTPQAYFTEVSLPNTSSAAISWWMA
jgi:aspartate aminotransferase